MQSYQADFLSGFRAERYQIELPEGFRRGQQRMAAKIRGTIKRDIGGDRQRIHHQHSEYDDITYKYRVASLVSLQLPLQGP